MPISKRNKLLDNSIFRHFEIQFNVIYNHKKDKQKFELDFKKLEFNMG